MNFESSEASIKAYIEANWSLTPVIWDNDDTSISHKSTRVILIDGDSEQVTVGVNGCHRRYGIMMAQFFVFKNTGTAVIRSYCDNFANLFKTVKIDDTTFESPTIVRVGDEGKFFQMNVQAPFYVDIIT